MASNFYRMTIATELSSLSGPLSETRVTATAAIASAAVTVANDNNHPRDGHNVDNRTRHAPLNATVASVATTTDATAAAAATAAAIADNEDDDNNDVQIHLIKTNVGKLPPTSDQTFTQGTSNHKSPPGHTMIVSGYSLRSSPVRGRPRTTTLGAKHFETFVLGLPLTGDNYHCHWGEGG
jgi:hypothetical protein